MLLWSRTWATKNMFLSLGIYLSVLYCKIRYVTYGMLHIIIGNSPVNLLKVEFNRSWLEVALPVFSAHPLPFSTHLIKVFHHLLQSPYCVSCFSLDPTLTKVKDSLAGPLKCWNPSSLEIKNGIYLYCMNKN